MSDGLRMADVVDNALGAYLKARRKKLDPSALGFSPGRRRTPGLRREEVAQRANVSTTWYTWLEQGRGGAPSADVLDRIARALALTDVEREHVYLLALGHPPEVRRAVAIACAITPQLQHVLDAIVAHPAMVATSTLDIVGWNAAAAIVLGDFSAIPAERRNSLRFMFSPGARTRGPNWERHARTIVALFRAETARIGTTERAAALIDELSRSSPEFATMWCEGDVAALGPGTKRFERDGGGFTLESSTFAVHGHADLHMIVYTPATPADAARLREILEAAESPRSAAG
jgi:transcriptional regulator with XRE-family HTH domain